MHHNIDDVRGIARAQTDRKNHIFMQRRLYIDEVHTALDIFPTAPPIHKTCSKAVNLRADSDSDISTSQWLLHNLVRIDTAARFCWTMGSEERSPRWHEHAAAVQQVCGSWSCGRVSVRIAVFPCSGNLCHEDRTIRTARNLTKTPNENLTSVLLSRRVFFS